MRAVILSEGSEIVSAALANEFRDYPGVAVWYKDSFSLPLKSAQIDMIQANR